MQIRQITFDGVNSKLKAITERTFAQLKYDGSQYHLHIANYKAYGLTSKRVSVKTNMLNEKLANFPFLQKMKFPFKKETILVVEASAEHLKDVAPNRRCGFVAGTCNSLPEKAADNQLSFLAHSFVMLEGKNVQHLTNGEQFIQLLMNFKLAGKMGENVKPCGIYVIENIPIPKLLKAAKKKYVQDVVNMKSFRHEGFVLKDMDSQAMLKVKKQLTADCIIVGYVDGTGKYAGQIGSLTVAVLRKSLVVATDIGKRNKLSISMVGTLLKHEALIEVGTVSGMTDTLREDFTTNFRKKYLGSIIECEYMEWTGNRMRHPRFNRIRDDKEIKRCTIAQLT